MAMERSRTGAGGFGALGGAAASAVRTHKKWARRLAGPNLFPDHNEFKKVISWFFCVVLKFL